MKKSMMVALLCGFAALVGSAVMADNALSGTKFEYKNTSMDLVRGTVTYSVLNNGKDPKNPYTAMILIKWGNLDNVKPVPKGYHENWDGYVQADQGKVTVAAKISFDDKWEKKPGSQYKPNSGEDELIDTGDPEKIEWLSGVVGYYDALLVRVDMPAATGTGTIKAGNFTFTFSIAPKPSRP